MEELDELKKTLLILGSTMIQLYEKLEKREKSGKCDMGIIHKELLDLLGRVFLPNLKTLEETLEKKWSEKRSKEWEVAAPILMKIEEDATESDINELKKNLVILKKGVRREVIEEVRRVLDEINRRVRERIIHLPEMINN